VADATAAELIDPAFWRMPLEDRMARFAELREIAPFLSASFDNPMSGETETFWITTRYAELVEISRRPDDCRRRRWNSSDRSSTWTTRVTRASAASCRARSRRGSSRPCSIQWRPFAAK
jgi:hypothetical protein